MSNIAFLLLQLLQRTDDELRRERTRERPDRLTLLWLKRRRRQIGERLRRSMSRPAAVAGV